MSHQKMHIARALGVMSFLLSLLAMGGSALSAPALAQPATVRVSTAPDCINYKGTFSLSLSDPNPTAGEMITIHGSGFAGPGIPNPMSVTIEVQGPTIIGTATTDVSGNFDLPWTIPADAKPGQVFTFTALCGDGANQPHTSATVVSATTVTTSVPGTSTSPLPRTGSGSTMPLLASGVSLLVVGGLILLAVRKRTQRAGHAV